MGEPVLSVRHLTIEFPRGDERTRVVDGVSFDLWPGETLGLIGESASGKSLTVLAIMGLAPPSAVISGEVRFDGQDLLTLGERRLQRIRGSDIAMVFQDPMTSLNPTRTIGWQLMEAIRTHHPDVTRRTARARVIDMLGSVGVPNAARRVDAYPHEFSGGMRQRVMLAMAVANRPRVLLADEPTTALDVTIQAQVIDLLDTVVRGQTGAAMIHISHDLALVSQHADRMAVMYGGKLVEVAPRRELFVQPHHPYTVGLLAGLPRLDNDVERLVPIPGQPPDPRDRPEGCTFYPRCPIGVDRDRCHEMEPPLIEVASAHTAACHYTKEVPDLVRQSEQKLGSHLTGGER